MSDIRQLELAKKLLESKGYKVTEKLEESATMADKPTVSSHAKEYILDTLGTSDESKIYVVDDSDHKSYRQFKKLLEDEEIEIAERGPSFVGVNLWKATYAGKPLVIAKEFGSMSFYFLDEDILANIPKDNKDDPLKGTIYEKSSFNHKMISNYYNKGKELLSSGKSVEQIINEVTPKLQELETTRKTELKLARKSSSDSDEFATHMRASNKAEDELLSLYDNKVVPVLVATEQLKFVSGGYGTKMKPLNPEYYLNALSKSKVSWYNYY